jgi:hypothetical protein
MRLSLRLAVVLALSAAPVLAQRAPLPQFGEETGLPYFDARFNGDQVRPQVQAAVAAARSEADVLAREAELAALREQVVELRMDTDELFGTPHFLRSTRQLLTGSASGAWSPAEVVADYVDAHGALFELPASEVLGARMARDFVTNKNGVTHLTFQQQVGGLDIWGAELKANVTAAGALINISSTLIPRPAGDFDVPAMRVSAQDAILSAFADVGVVADVLPRPLAPATGLEQQQEWDAGAVVRADLPLSTRLLMFPLDRVTVHPAWEVVVAVPGEGHTYWTMVDAVDGTVLRRWDSLHFLFGGTEDATYNIFPLDSPAPGSPGTTVPNGFQFPTVPRALVTSGATSGSPQGWIPDGANETLGNNVDAHLDLNSDNAPDLPRPAGSPYRVFDFPMDLAQAPSTYRDAAVTQLFYYCNLIHDVLYDYGFDEPSGNFQDDNFGLGGVDGDRISADAQDGSGTNNANWNGSGTDGSFCWIQMYVFDGPSPDRDGDFSGDVVYHEYLHGVSIRISGGTVFGEQSGAMGEGWGDFYGLCMSTEPGDDPTVAYAMGGWITNQFLGLVDNYYFGIRRYPYSSDFNQSPLTYADIDPAQFVVPGGIPNNGIFIGNPADEVHNAGEIWCQALLEARAELWNAGGLGFAANDLIMDLVLDGMKFMPSNPNMLEARDGVLQADLVNSGGANLGELWAGFAKRGMGASASSPSGSTTTGIVEAFDLPTLIVMTFPGGTPAQLAPGSTTTVAVDIAVLGADTPLPGTGLLHTSVNGGSFSTTPMVVTGANTYDAVLPALSCFDTLDWYVSIDSTAGIVNAPGLAPAVTNSSTVFTGVATLLSDEVEVSGSWSVGAGDDDASTGVWEHGDPVGTGAQPEDDHTDLGVNCFMTGQGLVGGGLGDNDVDGGKTTLFSPIIDLSSGDAVIGYWRWYSNTAGAEPNLDIFEVDVSNNGGGAWTSVEVVGPAGADTSGGWVHHEFTVSDFVTPTSDMQLRFVASDEANGSLVEAAVDDLTVTRLLCDTACQQDIGFGGPGNMAITLCGGDLSTGNDATLEVTGAPASGTVFLLAALQSNPTPFKGGTLVPIPFDLLISVSADGSGGASLPIVGGGGPLTVYVQAAAQDGGQTFGYAMSNALEAQFLP